MLIPLSTCAVWYTEHSDMSPGKWSISTSVPHSEVKDSGCLFLYPLVWYGILSILTCLLGNEAFHKKVCVLGFLRDKGRVFSDQALKFSNPHWISHWPHMKIFISCYFMNFKSTFWISGKSYQEEPLCLTALPWWMVPRAGWHARCCGQVSAGTSVADGSHE